jgi:hypothetical protein
MPLKWFGGPSLVIIFINTISSGTNGNVACRCDFDTFILTRQASLDAVVTSVILLVLLQGHIIEEQAAVR